MVWVKFHLAVLYRLKKYSSPVFARLIGFNIPACRRAGLFIGIIPEWFWTDLELHLVLFGEIPTNLFKLKYFYLWIFSFQKAAEP
jgi:hypothetical protein